MLKHQFTINPKKCKEIHMILNMKKIVTNAHFSLISIFINQHLVQAQELILLCIQRILLIKILIELKKLDIKNY